MPWVQVSTDNFDRANTVVAATPGTVGNGWIDAFGSTWRIQSNRLENTLGNIVRYLGRQTSENQVNQRLIVRYLYAANNKNFYLRISGTNNYYVYQNSPTARSLFTIINGATTETLISGVAYSATPSTNDIIEVEFIALGSNPTIMECYTRNITTGQTIASNTGISNSRAELQTSGSMGVGQPTGAGFWEEIRTFRDSNLTASPTTVTINTNGQVINLSNPTATWLSTTPTFTLSGGTGASITSQNILTNTTATITINTGSTTGILTVTDPSTSDIAEINATTPATTYTLSGASAGFLNLASAPFTVAIPNGTGLSGDVIVTPSDSGGGGSFAPSTVTLNNANPSRTFTYTPTSTGTKTISTTNNGGLTNPSSLSFVVTASIPVTDSNLIWSPYNWRFSGSTFAESINPGAYVKLAFAGTTLQIIVDVSHIVAAGILAANYPVIRTVIDGGAAIDTQLTSSSGTITITNSLSSGNHTALITFRSIEIASGNRWTRSNSVRINGFLLAAGQLLQAQTANSRRAIFYGDSITEGAQSDGGLQLADRSFASVCGQALTTEYGVIGFAGTGWGKNQGLTPNFVGTWNNHSDGISRLVGGLYSPQPDYIVVTLGHNDSAGQPVEVNMTSWFTAARAAAPSAKIFFVIPFSQINQSRITTTFNSIADADSYLINLGAEGAIGMAGVTGVYSADGTHPTTFGAARLGAMLARAIQEKLLLKQQSTWSKRVWARRT